jgi:hypothetical protein
LPRAVTIAEAGPVLTQGAGDCDQDGDGQKHGRLCVKTSICTRTNKGWSCFDAKWMIRD